MKNKNIQTLIFGCAAVLCTQAGLLMYVPSLQTIQSSLNFTQSIASGTLSIYVLGYALAMLFFGGYTDYIGRRKGYLLTFFFYSLASFILMYSRNPIIFLLTRFVQGIAGGGCAVIARSSIRDISNGVQLVKGMSYVSMTFNVSMGVLQLLGVFIEHSCSYRVDFALMGVLGVVLFVGVFYYFDETRSVKRLASTVLNEYKIAINNGLLLRSSLVAGLGYSVLLVFNLLGFPYIFSHYKASWQLLSVIGVVFSVSYLLGGVLLQFAIRRYTLKSILNFSSFSFLFIGIFSYALLSLGCNGIIVFIMPVLFTQIFQSILYPIVMSFALESYEGSAGISSSIFGFGQQLTASLATIVFSQFSTSSIFSFSISLILIGFVLSSVSLKNKYILGYSP